MTYSLSSDVRREFKSLLDEGTVITDDKIVEFQLQSFSVINSYLSTRYSVPITGTSPVNQQDTVSFTAAAGAGEVKELKITADGKTKTYSYTTVGADSATVIRDAIKTAVNADKNRFIECEASGAGDLVISSRVLGYAYGVAVTGTGVSFVNNVAAVLGSSALRVVRKIETELVACKIASILKTKVAQKLETSGVRQDIKDESCGKQAMQLLMDLQKGNAMLEDTPLVSQSGGLTDYNYANGYEGKFDIERKQW